MVGLRYGNDAGDPEALWAASPDDDRSERSILHLAHPQGRSDDRSRYVRYATAMAQLADWRRSGVLLPDDMPSVYRLRLGSTELWSGLIRLDSMELPEVAPVEKTHPQRVLEATMTFFEFPVLSAEFSAPEAEEIAAGEWRGGPWSLARSADEILISPDRFLAGAAIAAAAAELVSARREATNWLPVWVLREPGDRSMVPMGLLAWSQNEFK